MNQPRIIACGEVLWDLFPSGARFGGAPANFACYAALQGAQVSMISAVGKDAQGEEALTILQRCGVDTSLIAQLSEAATGSVGVALNPEGKPTYTIHENAAWDQLTWSDALETEIVSGHALYFGTLGQRDLRAQHTIQRAANCAQVHGLLRVLDVNLRAPFYSNHLLVESIALANVLKLSDDEYERVLAAMEVPAEAQPAKSLRRLLDKCDLRLIAMTRGENGALLMTHDEVVDQPGVPVTVRDTVGAGDSFTASLTVGMLRGTPLPELARQACETAATVCAYDGAVPAEMLLDRAAR